MNGSLLATAFLSSALGLPLLDRDCPKRAVLEQLDREVLACQQRVQMAEEATRSCDIGGPPPVVYTELLQAFGDTEVEVIRDGGRVAVVIPSNLLFSPNTVEVRREAMLVVDLVATALKLHPEQSAWLIGHTDEAPLSRDAVGRFGDHATLSFAQAHSFAQVLTGTFEVEPSRLSATGRGAARPRVASETDGAREQNRRLVVLIGPGEDWL
jgi:chemotaxis protein MotB